jgi:biopolymer transport protein ExbD
LNETQLPEAELEPSLRRVNSGGDLSVEIMADEKVAYGAVAKVMAAIQRAGIAKFTFVMLPEVANPNLVK